MKKFPMIVLLSAIVVSGCEVAGPKVRVDPPRVKVDGVHVENDGHKEKFCPPGQAKKGQC